MNTKIELILQHGWAFDSLSWNTWIPHVSNIPGYELSVETPERGYFAEPSKPAKFQHRDSIKLIVAHSFGLHLVPEELFAKADLLVAISSFSFFHGQDLISQKRSKRAVRLMQEKMISAPMDVIDEFYSNCYSPLLTRQALLKRGAEARLNLDLLENDLDLLNNNKVDLNLLALPKRRLFLHGANDIIVPPQHSIALHDELPNSSIILFEGVGHALPFTHAAPCWLSIHQFLQNISPIQAR